MNDAENLSKMLNHVQPDYFRKFIAEHFQVELQEIDPKKGKREIRAGFADTLSSLPVAERQKMEELAEKIVLLTDGPGQDAVDSVRYEHFTEAAQQEAFEKLGNQYDRSLWLFGEDLRLFNEAIDARSAAVFRQSASCYSGFIGPKDLVLREDTASVDTFHEKVAEQFKCPKDQVAVQVFRRLHPDSQTGDDVALYQVSIHYNLAPEAVECVKDSQLDSQQVTRAVSSFITYEPDNGNLEVLSKDGNGREALARLAADHLLRSSITGERIPLKRYDYQCLATPFQFDIQGENVDWARVTQLGYTKSGRSMILKIGIKDPDDIYQASRDMVTADFKFSRHVITFAQISLKIRKQSGERARTVHIVLRGENGCNIKTKREKDRVLCDHLLEKWGIVREIGDESLAAA
ncbi:hypothetical protein TspCOW1_01810 [Thiohalobacter sp. COW1]|nr:hypothetical protein TspCOW1_01810 [Thiohalobacter sp. COW1]